MFVIMVLCLMFSQSCFSVRAPERMSCSINVDNNDTLLCDRMIPKVIPFGVQRVILNNIDFERTLYVNKSMFSGFNWNTVHYLEINSLRDSDKLKGIHLMPNCLTGMSELRILSIHSLQLNIYNFSFSGLDKVEVLNMSYSRDLNSSAFMASLMSNDSFPVLTYLYLVGTFTSPTIPFSIDLDVFRMLYLKPIKVLDISMTEVAYLDARYFVLMCMKCPLEVLNASKIRIGAFSHLTAFFTCPRLRTADLSYSVFPVKSRAECIPSFYNVANIVIDVTKFTMFANVETLKLDGFCPKSYPPRRFVNVTGISIKSNSYWKLKHVSLNEMNFQTMDLEIICPKHVSIVSLEMQANVIDYVNPKLLGCLYTLEYLNLSGNKLGTMSLGHSVLFGKLFTDLRELRYLSLSRNDIQAIPEEMFKTNTKLQYLDLSVNSLSQVTFSLKPLTELKLLNMSYNKFKTLNGLSRTNLISIQAAHLHPIVDVRGNTLSCSLCDDHEYIEWVVKHSMLFAGQLDCVSPEGVKKISEQTANALNNICQRTKTFVILGTVPAGLLLLTLAIFLGTLRIQKIHKRWKVKKHMFNRIQNPDTSDVDTEFLVCILSSEENAELVFALRPILGYSLSVRFQTTRTLIFKDSLLGPGSSILRSVYKGIESSAVVLVVISPNCDGDSEFVHCLETALVEKPIVLLLCNVAGDICVPEHICMCLRRCKSYQFVLQNGDSQMDVAIIQNIVDAIEEELLTIRLLETKRR